MSALGRWKLGRRSVASFLGIVLAVISWGGSGTCDAKTAVAYAPNIVGLETLTFTPRTPVVTLVKTMQPETISATLYALPEDVLLRAFARYSGLMPEDVAGLFPMREITSEPISGTNPEHRIDLDVLPIGEYALALKTVDAIGIQRISVTSLGTFSRVTGAHVHALALDLRTMRRRSDVTFTVPGQHGAGSKHKGNDGFARFDMDANSGDLLEARADDGSFALQRMQGGGIPGGPRSYMLTDRPIYRPGDVVRFWGVSRVGTPGGLSSASGPRGFYIGDSKTTFVNSTITPGLAGTYSGAYAIPENSTPGEYDIGSLYGGAKITVVAAVSRRLVLRVDSSTGSVSIGKPAAFVVTASNVFGRPMPGISVTGDARQSMFSGVFTGHSAPFNDIGPMHAVTDSNGRAEIMVPSPRDVFVGEYITLAVAASDARGGESRAVASQTVVPSMEYFKTSSVSDRIGGQPGASMIVALYDSKGNPEPNRDVSIELCPKYIWPWAKPVHETAKTNQAGIALFHVAAVRQGGYTLCASARAATGIGTVTAGGETAVRFGSADGAGSLIIPSAAAAGPGQTIPTHIIRSSDGDVLVETGSGEPVVQVVRVMANEAWVPVIVPVHGTDTHIGFMAPGPSSPERSETIVNIAPPTDLLSVDLRTSAGDDHPGHNGRLAIMVRDGSGAGCVARLFVSVVQLSAAMIGMDSKKPVYDTIYETWDYQPVGSQSWYGLNSMPESQLVPTPRPRASGSPLPSDVYWVGTSTAIDSQPQAQPTPKPVLWSAVTDVRADPNTILWSPSLATDTQGRVSLPVHWPSHPDAYQFHAIAVTSDGRIGELMTTIIVR
jgi:hypothetical protein